jgi:hypothetical protein
MKETRDLLMEDYRKASDLIQVLPPESRDLDKLMKERDDIRNELIKVDSAELDAKLKREESKVEDKREMVRNVITIATTFVTCAITVWGVRKSFKFDETGTMTSTLGRSIIGGLVPKIKQK